MKKRLDYIDCARGILISLMVIGHVWQSGFVFDTIYAFHMPAFFVISGILMQHTKSWEKPFGKFLWGKVLAYGIPLVWIELLGILTEILRNGVQLNIKGYRFNTLTLNFNDPNLWFLADLFLIEVLVTVLTRIIKKPAVIMSLAAVLFFARYLLPTQLLYVSTVSSVMRYLPLFLVGFFCADRWKKVHIPTAVLCGVVVLACVVFGSAVKGLGEIPGDLLYLLSGCCGTYAVLCIGQACLPEMWNKALVYAGKNTILIYGTHHIYYVALGLVLGVENFTATPIGTGLIILAGVILLEIPTIYIINRWLPFLTGKLRKPARSAS